MTLGDIIKEYRKEHGVSQDVIAERSGLSKAYISILERNRNPKTGEPPVASPKTINAIAVAINSDFDAIFSKLDPNLKVSVGEQLPLTWAAPMSSPENIKLGQRIKQRRQELDMTQGDIASQIGVAVSTIQRYEAGAIDRPKLPVIEAIANAISVNPDWLVGKSQSLSPRISASPPNIVPLPTMKKWPVLGATACGAPLHRELLDETILAPSDIKADVVFRCVGDSMINARIFDGDHVFIRLQPEVENGEIAVVRIRDEYTLKRVYIFQDYVELRAENPTVRPIIISRVENCIDQFEIVGLAVAFLSAVR